MTFHKGRPDGRSNQQVVIDLVHAAEPGTIYAYDQLKLALETGSTRASWTLHDVQNAVRMASGRLLKEHQRALRNVAKVGYKVAHAGEHTQLCVLRRRKGEAQFKRGVALLEQVRWDEMDENSRRVHEGQLMIMGAMYQQLSGFERRMSAIEKAIQQAR